ncbi:MAG: hypothetical protein NW207_11775 [Cytophagales bacterium]|nr:hypothetical protein [Cytophagales bacterium]
MDSEDKDFLDFADAAQVHGLQYIIIGGFALYLNGIKRNTEDVYIWLKPTNENKIILLNVFTELGYTLEDLNDINKHNFSHPLVFSAFGHMDFLTVLHDKLDFDTCFQNSRTHVLTHCTICNYLHINDLKKVKNTVKPRVRLS